MNPLILGVVARCKDLDDRSVLADCSTGRSPTPQEFWRDIGSVADRLKSSGVTRGDHVAVTMQPDEVFVHVIYACFLLGAVPALVDPATGPRVLGKVMTELGPRLWISKDLVAGHDTCPADRFDVRGEAATSSHDAGVEPVRSRPDDPIMLLYTSGTTGLPKGVPWTSRQLSSYLDVQRRSYADHRIRSEFAFFAHLGIKAIAMGRRAVLPHLNETQPASLDISKAVRQMSRYGCDYTFASPVFWRRLIKYCSAEQVVPPPVKVAATAGAAVDQKMLNDLGALLPAAGIYVPYASTEALMPITSIDATERAELTRSGVPAGAGVPLGRAVDTKVAVIGLESTSPQELSDADVLGPGEVGEIIVSGPRVTTEYFKRPELTQYAKLRHSGDGSLWHRMGDVGYLDKSGLLWFLCRKKDVAALDSGAVYPDQMEQLYRYELDLEACAVVVTAGRPKLALIIEAGLAAHLTQERIGEVAERYSVPVPTLCRYPGRLPSDRRHNSKIDRESLAEWASR